MTNKTRIKILRKHFREPPDNFLIRSCVQQGGWLIRHGNPLVNIIRFPHCLLLPISLFNKCGFVSDVEVAFLNGSPIESEGLAEFSRGFVRLSPLFAPLSPFPPLCISVLTESLIFVLSNSLSDASPSLLLPHFQGGEGMERVGSGGRRTKYIDKHSNEKGNITRMEGDKPHFYSAVCLSVYRTD